MNVTHALSTELFVTRSQLLQESLRRTAEQYHLANSLLKQKILAASRSKDQASGVEGDVGEVCEHPRKRRAVAATDDEAATEDEAREGKTFIVVS
jgi:hypothetical protein